MIIIGYDFDVDVLFFFISFLDIWVCLKVENVTISDLFDLLNVCEF